MIAGVRKNSACRASRPGLGASEMPNASALRQASEGWLRAPSHSPTVSVLLTYHLDHARGDASPTSEIGILSVDRQLSLHPTERRGDRGKRAAVRGTGAEALQRLQVFGRRVALVAREAIAGKEGIE